MYVKKEIFLSWPDPMRFLLKKSNSRGQTKEVIEMLSGLKEATSHEFWAAKK